MGGGEIVKVDLGICREIDRYTRMYVLEENKAGEKDRERGMCYLLSTALDFPEEERMMQ